MTSRLYDHWDIYRSIFPVEEESVRFFASLLPTGGMLLDAGGGPGDLAAHLQTAQRHVVSIDLARTKPRAPIGMLRGDLLDIPLRDRSVDAVVSRLFSVAYASAGGREAARVCAAELARVTRPGGSLALELPVAHRPSRLQGWEESLELSPQLSYQFRYLDELHRTEFGSILATVITVRVGKELHLLEAPLLVFHPTGVRAWLAAAGFSAPTFLAPYDLDTRCEEPPSDCLRAIVYTTRTGGGGAAVPSTVANG